MFKSRFVCYLLLVDVIKLFGLNLDLAPGKNTHLLHHKGKYHCTDDLLYYLLRFGWFAYIDVRRDSLAWLNLHKWNSRSAVQWCVHPLWSEQCDQKKWPNVYKSCPKNDFTRKTIDFDTIKKLPKNVGDLANELLPKALKSCQKSNKSPNLVTLMVNQFWDCLLK